MDGGETRFRTRCIRLDASPPDDLPLFRRLSAAERQRAHGYGAPIDRRRFVLRRWWLRSVLGEVLNRAPELIELVEQPGGPPRLGGPGPSFSLSHCSGVALIAIASSGPVGCDIERLDAAADLDSLAQAVCSPAELVRLHGTDPADKVGSFYRLWTRKEAFVKALGVGMRQGWERIDVGDDAVLPRIEGRHATGWSIRSFRPLSGYVAAIAAPRMGRVVEEPPENWPHGVRIS